MDAPHLHKLRTFLVPVSEAAVHQNHPENQGTVFPERGFLWQCTCHFPSVSTVIDLQIAWCLNQSRILTPLGEALDLKMNEG